ncbi:pentapeptide repeat-containing protein [Candidatus Symbiopectobacterium sp. NZEC135]|uniref:pentapeptide repeat-containing protein n=1 Tax=Candidatus Symbiopectobacterium sp. NZEC135 TaxID=2820471 RepID=UPI002226A91D|nr:pentapeptide repeat-containing protein [Candidatus Symbiopectobacterium sp. NZEC135]MCW2479023.1 pentapeptide repeat-containing protein [Candidatus Symbiopectobacterium sp. NZEC135]
MPNIDQASRMAVATIGVGTRSYMEDVTSPQSLLEYIFDLFSFGYLHERKKKEYDQFLLAMADALKKADESTETLVVDVERYSVIFNMAGRNNPAGDVSVVVKDRKSCVSAKISSLTYHNVCRAIRFRTEHQLPLSTFLLTEKGAMNLRGEELSGARLAGVDLYNADLQGANLSGADLSGADLRLAQLQHAMLPGANLAGARLSNTHMEKANLSGATLEGAIMPGVFMQGAILSGVKLQHATLPYADLRDSVLPGADLRNASITAADFSGSDLAGADLSGVRMHKNLFSGSNLSMARLNMAETNVIADISEEVQEWESATMRPYQ